jgi:hypothetical protein
MLRRGGMAAVLVLGVLALPASAQVTLKWKFAKGDKFYLRTDSILDQTITSSGAEVKQKIEQSMLSSFTVKEKKTDDSVVLEQKIETVTVKTAGPGAEDTKPPKGLEGATFTITVSPKWQITKFDGYDALIKKLSGEDAAVDKMIRAFLPEEILRASAEEAFGFLPDKAVKKGDTWERKLVYPLGPLGTLTATNKYTYEDKNKEKVNGKEVERITAAMDIKYTPPMPGGAALGLQIIDGDLKAKDAKQTIFFDAAAGRMVQSETKMRVEGMLSYSAVGKKTEIEIKQDQTITAQVFDKDPRPK